MRMQKVVSSVENLEQPNVSPFKVWSRSEYIHTYFVLCQQFHAFLNFDFPSSFYFIYYKSSLHFLYVSSVAIMQVST